ncbi:MAG: diguanylate cyclase [Candidatus Thiodiazotropha sp. (ex Dulcina madagascariensis)]|nr:diguanylate cyclase [Candidatus Thiodiazotropha sp. (ex Dulcina madagascariensis)]MCU7925169.1 diguanylate cyclase [Candidatus Thiodiazotropha sp. (ex Dulcina madagascariensis)]
MSVPAEYRISEKIHEGALTLIYRARHREDGRPVILKTLRSEYPGQRELDRLRVEYENAKGLDDDNIIKVIGYEERGKTATLVLEDFGGTSIDRILSVERPGLEDCLHIALKVAQAMETLHARQMVHKDINPSNIVWNRESNEVKLIDMGFAAVLPAGRAMPFSPDVVEGTLAYISPEQTGRINRLLDYRSDLYSLGVSLYELVTGQPPFSTDDAMELVHAHIARQPVPPHVMDPAIPEGLSAVIMKLLAKTAEERYQSSYGLRHDLEACVRQLWPGHTPEPFTPGEMDISGTFTVSQKLYGREEESAVLLDALERAHRGSGELVMIGGYSGVGKTTLVHEIQKPVVERRGYFAMGKFDPLNRSMPYQAFIQAFKALVRQLLSESEASIQRWRRRLLGALTPNGQVVAAVIPEVEHIIGPQPAIPELPPQESQNRFDLVFQHFIQAFSSTEYPLTLFLDDLQWADAASLRLLELFMCDGDTQHLLILGTYRDNEVDAAHPLSLTLDQIRKSHASLSEITLQPLTLQHARALIADSLHSEEGKVEALARICMEKTLGNPFFLTQLLHALYGSECITFNPEQGQWAWDLKRIAGAEIADSVVDLMVEKIHRLPEPTQAVLKLAAAIGERFDLKTVAIVHERSMSQCSEALLPAVQYGLIYPASDTRLFTEEPGIDHRDLSYRFLHDRVHQAAYSLIDDARKRAVHLQIGRLLLQRLDAEQRDEQVFKLVNHFNLGIALITAPKEREQLARLNLQAGQKAKRSAANSAAFGYLTQGIELLTESAWDDSHALAMTLHEEAAEAAYLSQRYEEMETLLEQVLAHTRAVLEKAKAYRIRILANTARYRLKEAVETGLEFLDCLDIHFPLPADQEYIGARLTHIGKALGVRSIDSLSRLPKMTDPRALAVMETLTTLASPAYNYSPELFLLLVLKQVELSLSRGNAADSAFAYSTYALVLCAVEERYDDGDAFGRLSIDLMRRLKAESFKAKIYLDVYLFVHHWKHPLRETLKPLLEAYRSGLDQGDLLFAALSAHVYCHHTLFSARSLPETAEEFTAYHAAIARLDQQAVLHWTEIFQQTVLNLMGRNDEPLNLNGEAFSEVDKAYLFKEENDKTACFLYHFNKLILCCLFGVYDQALVHAQRAEDYLHSVMGIIHVPLCRFYASLTRLALTGSAEGVQREALLATVTPYREQLKQWADSAPMNYAHKYLLVEAENWRVLGKSDKAETCYDQAATLAAENGYTHDEALANELAGRYYLEKGRLKIARLYLRDALYAYSRWGAEAKVRALQEKYGELFVAMETHSLRSGTERLGSSGETSLHSLDLASVLRVSQTITAEIVLERLLDKVMTTVMENAGAQRGFLISGNQEGRLGIEVEAHSAVKTRKVFKPGPLADRDDLSAAIVHYVARTGETLVLIDAANEGLFIADPYVLEHHPKSILCMPLSNRGRLTVILYLENNLITDAFTPDHLELLNLLSSQMAVSIENAKLYEGLEERVGERTEQLNDKVEELSQAYETLKQTQSELKHANAKLERDKELLQELSSTDRLTSLYNRSKLEELFEYELNQCRRYNTPLSLIMIDLDHFKAVNDSYGHHAGDLVLQDMAAILTRSSRTSDVVARWGGEEFLILAPKTDLDHAAQLAEKIRAAVEAHPFAEVGKRTGSFGVACYRERDTLTSLLQRADLAMYQAKKEGRNQVVVGRDDTSA